MKNIKDDMDIIFLSDSSQPDMESLVVRAHQAPNQFRIFSLEAVKKIGKI